MGYGSRALELLVDFYEGKFANLSEDVSDSSEEMVRVTDDQVRKIHTYWTTTSMSETFAMPPLFVKLLRNGPTHSTMSVSVTA